MNNEENRRPLKIRSWHKTQKWAYWLSQKDITPNQISLASIGFAALAGFLFLLFPYSSAAGLWVVALLVPVCLLGRGFCNIFDGLVAIEGGKSTRSGELFNDVPDRLSDALIIVGSGYACGFASLGWLAATLAMMTAYVRTMVRSIGAPSDFQGPMGKVQRMAVIGLASSLTPVGASYFNHFMFLQLGLLIICSGCIVTMWRRLKTAYNYLENNADA